jgi:flagellar biosynthesis activator protein FlaF
MSIQAYQRAATQAESPRQLEYRALGLATSGLLRAHEAGKSDFAGLLAALDKNRQLWSMLASDCMIDGNSLPPPVRAQIISLSLFVSRYTSQVLRDGVSLEPLIDLNKTIMDGLAGT